jgi:DNA-binding CsgD family transcriptional regulator
MTNALRRTGIEVLGGVPWGAHICLFYETKQDLLDTNVAYFRAGLTHREFCVWVVSDPIQEADARAALALRMPDFERQQAEGRIEIVDGRDWYLKNGKVDPPRIIDGWLRKLRAALDSGFEGMRVSGNAFWLGTDHWAHFLDYERELERSFVGHNIVALCTYALGASRGLDLLDVMHAHDTTIARRNGAWKVVEAFSAVDGPRALTDREREVLTWVARGKSAWEIGEMLRISKRTVDEHVRSATHKLGAANRTHAAAVGIRERIIHPGTQSK